MSTARIKIKRLIIIIVIFIICVLPVFISGTYSTPDTGVIENGSSPVRTGTATSASDVNTAPGSLSSGSQSTGLYPCDISESENNGLRQIIKTYELDAGESPDCIPKGNFESGGWLYTFTDLTKKESSVNVTKDDSVTINIDSNTKDADEIIGRLAPTLEYSSPDGFTGLLSLDISSIVVEATDKVEANQSTEADPSSDAAKTETEPVISDESNIGLPDTGPSYHTTAVYRGTLSKLLNDKTIYSAYFTGMVITPSPMPIAPLVSNEPVEQNKPSLAKAVIISSCIALICCLLYFFLFRGNVKVYNLNDSAYVLLGEARIGFTYAVINLTPFAGKAVTGNFILVINRHVTNRLSDKQVTINYGGKSLQHIIRFTDNEYRIEVSF